MKNIKLMTKEEALKMARAQKGDMNTGAGVLYGLLQNAHPAMQEYFEDQLATAIQVGSAMGKYVASMEPGTPEYDEYMNALQQLANKSSFAKKSDDAVPASGGQEAAPKDSVDIESKEG